MIFEYVLTGSIVICGLLAVYAIYLFAKTPASERVPEGQPSISFIEGVSVVGIFAFSAWISPIINQYVTTLSPAWRICIAVFSVVIILLILILAKYAKNKT